MTDATTQDVTDRIDRLEERIDDLESMVSALRGEETDGTADTLDRYDATVLDALEKGQVVSSDALRQLYRTAGIKKDRTLTRRVKDVVRMPHFEREGHGSWRFVGGENT